MPTFKVFQAQLSDAQVAELNGPDGGWDSKPEFSAYAAVGMGGMGGRDVENTAMDAAMHKLFNHVCNIEADELHQVFEVGNIGPEERITRVTWPNRMSSVSVGNLVLDPEGKLWFCDTYGWTEISRNKVAILARITQYPAAVVPA